MRQHFGTVIAQGQAAEFLNGVASVFEQDQLAVEHRGQKPFRRSCSNQAAVLDEGPLSMTPGGSQALVELQAIDAVVDRIDAVTQADRRMRIRRELTERAQWRGIDGAVGTK